MFGRMGFVGALVAAVVASTSVVLGTGAATPHRTVLLVGDSLVRDATPAVRDELASHGVALEVVTNPGEGLLTDQARWNQQLTDAVDRLRPDVVVLEACCDYDPTKAPYVAPNGQVVPLDTEAMFHQWAVVAFDAVRRAKAHGAAVHWVVTPDPAPNTWFGGLGPRIDRFNAIYDTLDVPLVDWRDAVAAQPMVRGPDGLHLTDAGNRLVADVTWRAIAADLPTAHR